MNIKSTHITDIRLIILFFFLIRLIGITNPPLEIGHNWRQCSTNMYARNFLEIDNNILYSRVDMAGELTGITAKEFPIFNYLIYLTAEVFGWEHWYGRLINLIISSIGVWFFFLIIRDSLNERTAFHASLFLLASTWFGFSRKIMPDTFSVSLGFIGLYFGLKYLKKNSLFPSRYLLFYFLFGTLAVLSKIPTIYLFSILTIPFLTNKLLISRRLQFIAASACLLGINYWWYFYWMPHIVETYGYEHYPMRTFLTGAKELFGNPLGVFFQFAEHGFKSYVAFVIFVLGIIWANLKSEKLIILVLLIPSFFFFIFMIQAGETFYFHDYYMIPFVPIMALLAGHFLTKINNPKIIIFLLLVIFTESLLNQQNEFWIKDREKHKLELEKIADMFSNRNDLVIFHDEAGNPQQLFFAHRKGWMLPKERIRDTTFMNTLHKRGAKLILIDKNIWKENHGVKLNVVLDNKDYKVYQFR